jgi:hypothetical protein
MSEQTKFLCTPCRREMCADCRGIADEYAELLSNRTQALGQADWKLREAERKAEEAESRAASYKQIVELGLPPVTLAWMDSLTPDALLKAAQNAEDAARLDFMQRELEGHRELILDAREVGGSIREAIDAARRQVVNL